MAVDATVVAAGIAAVPATVASIAAWRAANKTRVNTTTSNGLSAGMMIERIHHELEAHIQDQQAHCQEAHEHHECS